jgi:hypothetical protein
MRVEDQRRSGSERSRSDLGAMTVMVVAVVTYAAIAGAIVLMGALLDVSSGEVNVARFVLAILLVSPAAAALRLARRPSPAHRRPHGR